MIDRKYEQALKFALGADKVGHSGRTLYEHLKGTHDLLLEWGAPEHVRLAGLFHSIYGTIYFKHQCLEPTLKNRELVAELIGQKAERLAYLFCTSDRPHFDAQGPDQEQELEDLRLIERANLQEQTRSPQPVAGGS
jgi:hypothetical protein